MNLNIKIKPYAKIPRGLELFLGRYLIYGKNRREHQRKYANLEERLINYLLISMGEIVKFMFTIFAYVVVKIKVIFGIEIRNTEKYFD